MKPFNKAVFFLSFLLMSPYVMAGLSTRFAVRGKVYSFDANSVTIVSSPTQAWKAERSLINPKIDLKPGEMIIIEGDHKQVQSVRVPRNN